MNEFRHVSVLLSECIDALAIKPEGTYVDCTLGGGGHSLEIVKRLTVGRLIAIDRDGDALSAAGQRLAGYRDKITFVKDNFENLAAVIAKYAPDGVDGVLFDLGVSSYQLDTGERGFSYHADAPLDMRMDRDSDFSAYDVVNTYSCADLARIIRDYGEERYASRIASAIVKRRELQPIETTLELSDIIKSVFPPKERFEGKNPSRRTFQAIRIEVNRELDAIPAALDAAVAGLKSGGRIAVITFHSLEDRLVKEKFREYIDGCTCPKDFPVCVCGFKPSLKLINKKPITADTQELDENLRARSAKLRIAEKL